MKATECTVFSCFFLNISLHLGFQNFEHCEFIFYFLKLTFRNLKLNTLTYIFFYQTIEFSVTRGCTDL